MAMDAGKNPQVETQETIGTWAIAKFGRGEEMLPYAEEIEYLTEDLVECAYCYDARWIDQSSDLRFADVADNLTDILITIRIFAHCFQIDLDQLVNEKMSINRNEQT